jgi:hypothetical protein
MVIFFGLQNVAWLVQLVQWISRSWVQIMIKRFMFSVDKLCVDGNWITLISCVSFLCGWIAIIMCPCSVCVQKQGKWCAVHVRIAWEIYRHQQQRGQDGVPGSSKPADKPPSLIDPLRASDPLRPPSHLLPGGGLPRPPELPPVSSSLLASGELFFHCFTLACGQVFPCTRQTGK